jgi:alpha-beta hydrolase superfamily lysophospholipase
VSKHLSVVLFAALASITLSVPVSAQKRSTADASVLDAAIAARPDRNRALVSSALMSSSALAVAATMGLSPDAVAARIAALDDASTKQVADQILAGGDDRIVISTTAVIIGLLLIILLTR